MVFPGTFRADQNPAVSCNSANHPSCERYVTERHKIQIYRAVLYIAAVLKKDKLESGIARLQEPKIIYINFKESQTSSLEEKKKRPKKKGWEHFVTWYYVF